MARVFWLAAIVLLFSSVPFAQAPSAPAPKSDLIDSRQLLRDLQILSADDMEGRKSGTRGNAKAREYVVQRFKESGIAPLRESYLYPFTFSSRYLGETTPGVNVIGYLKGKTHPDQFLVVSAHYDHIGIQNGQVYNGADDNASGVSALFALGAYFEKHRPESSILFAAFDAEEAGLFGSREFLSHPPVAKASILMNINLDMICRDKTSTLYAVGTYEYPFLRPYLEMVIPRARVKLVLGHDRPDQGDDDWTQDSDHYSFHREKIPFIYFGVEDYDYHHKAGDDYENIMPGFYVGAVETVIDALQVFDADAIDIARSSPRRP